MVILIRITKLLLPSPLTESEPLLPSPSPFRLHHYLLLFNSKNTFVMSVLKSYAITGMPTLSILFISNSLFLSFSPGLLYYGPNILFS